MDINKAAQWQNDALDTVFEALATSKTLAARFIYKGARILNLLLDDTARQSLDIDANLTRQFIEQYPDRQNQLDEIQSEISIALTRFFDSQKEVVYALERVAVRQKAKREHPMGWDAFVARINLRDHRLPNVRGIRALDIDIAAPESLGPGSTATLEVGGNEIHAYTLERIAGEKFRAFLSSLPSYRRKIKRPGEAVRAKDLYDCARIVLAKPITDDVFWYAAGNEFQQACRSRYVDCLGIVSFQETIETTRATYESDAIIPNDIPFDFAWDVLRTIIAYWQAEGLIPFQFELPENALNS